AKAIEARVEGTLEKLGEAKRWEEADRESQKRSEYYLKAIQARAVGKADDATSWDNAGRGASFASDRLAKAIEARVVGTQEKLDEATRWEEAAALNRQAYESWIKAIQERAKGNKYGPTGGGYWDNEALKKFNEAQALANRI
ncbi:MAG: hypothetical protein ACH346_01960, partial [Chthoniobacterales bacterium]